MATRRLAFIGSRTEGPAVAIYGMATPVLRVRGLPQGESLIAMVGIDHVPVFVDGEYELPTGDWLRCKASVVCRTLICDVVSRDKVA